MRYCLDTTSAECEHCYARVTHTSPGGPWSPEEIRRWAKDHEKVCPRKKSLDAARLR